MTRGPVFGLSPVAIAFLWELSQGAAMIRWTILWAAGVGLLAAALAVNHTHAAMDDETNAAINKIADLLEKGNVDAAKKAAKEVADKNDVETFMDGFKPRNKKGIGVGHKPNVVVPDGIEKKIDAIVRDGITPAVLQKEAEGLTRAAYVTAAIGYIANAKAPEQDMGKKKKADWLEWSMGMVKAAGERGAAAKANSAADVKKAAAKIKQNCDSCHTVFK